MISPCQHDMIEKLHVWPQPLETHADQVTVSVTFEQPHKDSQKLWYRLPAAYAHAITPSSDPFVLGMLHRAMLAHQDLVVHGEVSLTLLRNLEEYQRAWALWLPKHYAPIDIIADVEREQTPAPDGAIFTFSGGMDSAFTAWRHHKAMCGRRTRKLRAGILVHGFDIPLAAADTFANRLAHARAMLSSLDMDVIPIATNLRQWGAEWFAMFGAGSASCLTLLQAGWNTGLISSGPAYNHLLIPNGSNPVTDYLLSTGAFEIVHDGADARRIDKARALAEWMEARQHLRVCWQSDLYRNCGHCRKCVRTILEFRAVGAGLPECFEQDASDWQIVTRVSSAAEFDYLDAAYKTVKANRVKGSWVWALGAAVQISRARRAAKKIVARE